MRNIKHLLILFCFILIASSSGYTQSKQMSSKVKFDAKLAKKLGADDYGMKNYMFVILRTGPKDSEFKGKERDDIFAGHMKNIGRLADEGKLVIAGPFMKNDKGYRGLFIFNVTTVEEAQKLVETDPAVKAGILIAEMTPWYGSASLLETPEIHKKIAKTNP